MKVSAYIMGKSKLAQQPAHTVTWLELCAAVLAVELYDLLRDDTDIDLDAVKFFTDSKIVLGYIHSSTRRCKTYVANRVTQIQKYTHPEQWDYMSTENNLSDHLTRPVQASQLQHKNCLSGPSFLTQSKPGPSQSDISLVDPEAGVEIRPNVISDQ